MLGIEKSLLKTVTLLTSVSSMQHSSQWHCGMGVVVVVNVVLVVVVVFVVVVLVVVVWVFVVVVVCVVVVTVVVVTVVLTKQPWEHPHVISLQSMLCVASCICRSFKTKLSPRKFTQAYCPVLSASIGNPGNDDLECNNNEKHSWILVVNNLRVRFLTDTNSVDCDSSSG